MGVRGAVGIGFVMVAALGACSLGDFSGYSGGDESSDAGSADAAPTSDDGGGGGDSSRQDASADAGVEAGRFCEANFDAGFFCEDFEGPNPLLHFDSLKTIGGTLVVDNGTMVADAPAGAPEAYAHGTVSAKTAGSGARIAFSVQPEILNTTTANANQLAKIYFTSDGNPSYEVGIGLHGAGSSTLYAYEYAGTGTYKEFGDLPPLAVGRMTRIVLEVHIEPSSPSPRLDVIRDGVTVVASEPLSPPVVEAGNIDFFVGFPYVPPDHGAWKLRYDDIVTGTLP